MDAHIHVCVTKQGRFLYFLNKKNPTQASKNLKFSNIQNKYNCLYVLYKYL